MTRPQTIAEIAQRDSEGRGAFDRAVREFLDAWQTMTPQRRAEALAEEPVRLDLVKNAYLAALCEHLALTERIDTPD
jgi:hypothetical protein